MAFRKLLHKVLRSAGITTGVRVAGEGRFSWSSFAWLRRQPGPGFRASQNRFYYVDREGYRHFKPRGAASWVPSGGISQRTGILLAVACGTMGVVYYTHLEVVPYTNRHHFVLIPPRSEQALGQMTFGEMKRQFKDKILPPDHPAVLRVARIAQKTINSAMEGVHRGAEAQLNYSLNVPHQQHPSLKGKVPDDPWGQSEEMRIPKYLVSEDDMYRKKDQVLDDVWVEETRKDGLQKGRKASTKHIDEFKWEIVVVNANVVNAACLPGGKIIVFTGILREFPDDDQIATVISHEVGHAIARHSAEMLTKSIFIGFIELLLLAIVQIPDAVATASQLLLRLPFSRKMEMEADHMGLLIMAGAGYNPRVAPSVYLKLGSLQKLPEYAQYISTHPSGKARAQALINSKAMQEAMTIYESKQGGWYSIGFLL